LSADGAGLSSEEEKGCLKGVVGIVFIAEDAPADAANHRPMALNQGSKRMIVTVAAEALEQASVVGRFDRGADQSADETQGSIGTTMLHFRSTSANDLHQQ
jgi:hypothetical protein